MRLFFSTAVSTTTIPGADDIDTLQEGPTCKIAALASCMRLLYPEDYYPLRKDKQNGVELSVRKIAKEQGSSQGEVTSPGHLSRIAQALGLKATPISFSNLSEMKYYIRSAIQNGKPVIVFALIDKEYHPTANPKYMYQAREHGSVVLGYHDDASSLLVHDGSDKDIWKANDLYASSCLLPKERSTETFVKFLVPIELSMSKLSESNKQGDDPKHSRLDSSGCAAEGFESAIDITLQPAASFCDNKQVDEQKETAEYSNLELDAADPEPMDWSDSYTEQELDRLALAQFYRDLFNAAECSHDIGNAACRYHDISNVRILGDVMEQRKTENLKRLEESGCITVRQSNQESDVSFHKLLMIVERCDL